MTIGPEFKGVSSFSVQQSDNYYWEDSQSKIVSLLVKQIAY